LDQSDIAMKLNLPESQVQGCWPGSVEFVPENSARLSRVIVYRRKAANIGINLSNMAGCN
jgi:hypothetical protein